MVKNVLKKSISSLLLLALIACSSSPTYSRKDIDQVIKNIALSEFKTEINSWAVGNTVWVFAPIKLFNERGELKVNKEGRLDEDLFESTRKISESINRALLNVENPPTFYCFIKSDILRAEGIDLLRLDSYELVFIPDQIRLQMASRGLGVPVSTKELSERVVIVQTPSIDSEILTDKQGNYIHKYDIPLPEFILLLIQQNIIRTFLSPENKDNFEINQLDLSYNLGNLNLEFNIKFKQFKEGLPVPLEKIEEITKKVINTYSSFTAVPKATIRDVFNEKTRTISFDYNPNLLPAVSITDKQTGHLLKLSQASLYTALASDLVANRQDLEKAAQLCNKAFKIIPDYLYALALLAEIYNQLNQPEQALLTLNQAISQDPRNPIIHLNLGELYQTSGKPQEALKHFEDTALLYPDYPGIFSKLALSHITLGNLEKASTYLERAVKQTEEQKIEDPENYRRLGDSYAQLGQYEKALVYLNKAKNLKPDYLPVYLSLGETYFLMGNSQEAVKNFEKILALNPDYGPAHLGLANTYLVLGQLPLAITEYEKTLQLYPENVDIYTNLSKAHIELGRKKSDSAEYEKAIAYLKKALKISPDNFNAYYRLGETYSYLEENYQAIEYFQNALKLNPESAEVYFELGLAWLNLGQNQKAKENFFKAHQIFYERKDYRNARQAEENMRNIP